MKTNRNELVRRLLTGVTKGELEFLVRKREEAMRPIPTMRGGEARRPIPTPRGNVQLLIQHFEANPIPQYRPIPASRKKKQQRIAGPRTRIGEERRP